jgi:CBS-domain-containing membrane protein
LRGIRPSDFALFDLPVIKFLTHKKDHSPESSEQHSSQKVQHYHFEHYDYSQDHEKKEGRDGGHHHHHHHQSDSHDSKDSAAHHDPSHPRVVSVTPKDNLATVLNLLVRFRLHRVYIVDEHHKPVGVVTLTDILQELVMHEA